jgi:hypothetical protein
MIRSQDSRWRLGPAQVAHHFGQKIERLSERDEIVES